MEFYDMAAIGRITPLKKGLKHKLRPGACGRTWNRLTTSTGRHEHKQKFHAQLSSEQYAVSVALEKLTATLPILLRQQPQAAVIQVDAVSAFTQMRRETML